MATAARKDLDERISASQELLAKKAIADPEGTDQYRRLKAAKSAREAADLEYNTALSEWNKLISHAPAAWKALSPRL